MPDRAQHEAADGGYFAPLALARNMRLTVFKRDDVPVFASVHGVVDGDRAYFCARNRSETVKHLRHTRAVQVTPCGVLGFCTYGQPLDAIARPLSAEEAALVAAELDRRYPVRRLSQARRLRRQPVYYELLPDDVVGGHGRLSGGPPAVLITRVHTSRGFFYPGAATPSSMATVCTPSSMSRPSPSDYTRIITVSMSLSSQP